MARSISKTDICNIALDLLRAEPISDIGDDDPNAQLCSRQFPNALDELLELHNWNFATRRTALPMMSEAPSHGWSYQYLKPGDCLRVLPLRKNDAFNGDLIPYIVEDDKILTNETAPLKLRYIYRNEAFGRWQQTAVTALGYLLASKIAHGLTGKNSSVEMAVGLFDNQFAVAKRLDGMQGTAEEAFHDDVISVRR